MTWKIENCLAADLLKNSDEQVGLGRFDSAYPPIIWAVTWREKETVSPDDAIAFAKKIGEKCAGIDTNRFVSVFDKERMDFLVNECKEVQ